MSQTTVNQQIATPPRKSIACLVLPTAVSVWLLAVVAGLAWLWAYQSTPGESTQASATWPSASQITRAADRPTLLMFAHPRCPCTRASIRELELILSHCSGRVDAHVVFFQPRESVRDWTGTDLWTQARAIPGVSVAGDSDGVEAERFGAKTSGYSLLYGADGRLMFSGGITASRGHSGDNAGRSAIESLLLNRTAVLRQTTTFGCPLTGCPRQQCGEEVTCLSQ